MMISNTTVNFANNGFRTIKSFLTIFLNTSLYGVVTIKPIHTFSLKSHKN